MHSPEPARSGQIEVWGGEQSSRRRHWSSWRLGHLDCNPYDIAIETEHKERQQVAAASYEPREAEAEPTVVRSVQVVGGVSRGSYPLSNMPINLRGTGPHAVDMSKF